MRIFKRIGIVFSVFILLGAAICRPAAAEPASTHLVWAQADGSGNYEIQYSRHDGASWESPTQISRSPEIDTLPAVAAGSDGSVWVVWSAVGEESSRLFYSRFDGSVWSEPMHIETGLSENTAPTVLVDGQGIPWVAWSGFDGTDDDIFIFRFQDGRWTSPVRVHENNDQPDILPALGSNSGNAIRVTWHGFDGERYRKHSRAFVPGEGWTDASVPETAVSGDAPVWNQDLPAFVRERTFAAIAFSGEDEPRSIRVLDASPKALDTFSPHTLSEATAAEAVVLLTLGDSITVGFPYYTGEMDGSTKGGYQPGLASRLEGPSQTVSVLNYGISGENTSQGLSRIDGVLARYSKARMMLLLEGTNDIHYFSRSTTYSNWRAMVDKCLAHSITPVLATLTPDTRPIMDGMKAINTTYNVEIRKIVVEKNISLCELYNPLRPDWEDRYTEDGLHPNRNGYSAIARIWFDSIKTPEVMTLNATSVGETDAVIQGAVNPKHFPARYYFEYGYDTSYGGMTPVLDAGSGNVPVGVTAALSTLSDNTVYHFRLVATNDYGTVFGNDLAFQTLESPSSGCFIATAAFGSPFESHVVTLRAFRDRYLMPHAWGKRAVRLYYTYSPALARRIADHESLKLLVRAGLYPVVGLCRAVMHPGSLRILFTGMLMGGGLILFGYCVKRRNRMRRLDGASVQKP